MLSRNVNREMQSSVSLLLLIMRPCRPVVEEGPGAVKCMLCAGARERVFLIEGQISAWVPRQEENLLLEEQHIRKCVLAMKLGCCMSSDQVQLKGFIYVVFIQEDSLNIDHGRSWCLVLSESITQHAREHLSLRSKVWRRDWPGGWQMRWWEVTEFGVVGEAVKAHNLRERKEV